MTGHPTPSILFIDNFDSFTFNLVDEFARRGCAVDVWRNSATLDELARALDALPPGPRLAVISPGPGSPGDAGCSLEFVRALHQAIPIFGVCLGHQVIVEAFGGQIGHAHETIHGKATRLEHDADGLFSGIKSPCVVGRYHSLCATAVPESLRVTARSGELVMAIEHEHLPIFGVQFHPESILTPAGGQLIDNILSRVARGRTP